MHRPHTDIMLISLRSFPTSATLKMRERAASCLPCIFRRLYFLKNDICRTMTFQVPFQPVSNHYIEGFERKKISSPFHISGVILSCLVQSSTSGLLHPGHTFTGLPPGGYSDSFKMRISKYGPTSDLFLRTGTSLMISSG